MTKYIFFGLSIHGKDFYTETRFKLNLNTIKLNFFFFFDWRCHQPSLPFTLFQTHSLKFMTEKPVEKSCNTIPQSDLSFINTKWEMQKLMCFYL